MAEGQDLSELVPAITQEESLNDENDHGQDLNPSPGTTKKSREILQEQFGSLRPFGTDDKSKEYRCSSCYKLAIDHCFSNCKHLFCIRCYLRNFQHPCPVCDTVLETNTLDDKFEKRLFELPIECEFKKNGCEDTVKLKDLQNHVKRCKFSQEKLLPKVYKADPTTEAIGRLTEDVKSIKETLTTLSENVELLDTAMKQIAGDEHKIAEINDKVKIIEERGKVLLVENRDIKDSHANICKKLFDDEMQNQTEIARLEDASTKFKNDNKEELEKMQQELFKLKEAKEQKEEIITQIRESHKTALKKLTDDHLRNTDEIKKMRTQILELHNNKESWLRFFIPILVGVVAAILAVVLFQIFDPKFKKVESRGKRLEDLETQTSTAYGSAIEELKNLDGDYFDGELPAVYTWKISGVQNMLKNITDGSFSFQNEKFFTTPNGLRFRSKIYTKYGRKYVFISLEFATTKKNVSPYLHSRRYVLIDQSQDVTKENVEKIDRPGFNRNSGNEMTSAYFDDIWFFPIHLLLGQSKYFKNDAILIQIIIEPIAFMWKQIESQKGVFVWRINDYSKKKKDEINGLKLWLTSIPFKTSDEGYTMHVVLCLNGDADGMGKYISIGLKFLFGEHDTFLQEPSNYKITFCLIDQSDSTAEENICDQFHFSFEMDGKPNGSTKFVLQSTVENSKYLKDDSIVIQTTVEMLNPL